MAFAGRLEADTIGTLWRQGMHAAHRARGRALVFDLTGVSFCDVGGATFLAAVEAAHGEAADVTGADERVVALLDRTRAASHAGAMPRPITLIPAIRLSRPTPDSTNPLKSKRGTVSSRRLWMNLSDSRMPRIPIGTLIQKIQRQWK